MVFYDLKLEQNWLSSLILIVPVAKEFSPAFDGKH